MASAALARPDKVFAVLNLSDPPQSVTFKEALYHGSYTDYFAGRAVGLDGASCLELDPWVRSCLREVT